MHGYDLAPDDHALLRSPPPSAALRWVAAAVGDGAEIVQVVALEGGTSSAVHALDVRERDGRTRRLVLRRFVREDWLEEEPDAPLREAAALRALNACALATPELVALDADGDSAGDPAVLMTRLDGATIWQPRPDELDDFLRKLVVTLMRIHATPLEPGASVPPYEDWGLDLQRPPRASALAAGVWERAFAAFDRTPSPGTVLLHRDYHPGNVLWLGGEVSGVVDWASTSVGMPDADVGYCRENLVRSLGIAAADRFLELHRELTGAGGFDPYWDIQALLGGFADDDLDGWTARDDEYLARAVAGL
ncbi:phosphotransferase family protein [Conexibacter woesei]|uniref:Aminoglycoside phosphotransferase n=1 Tax=Conexibacter woesei (strain DSM 14684 / CCUG 47730 / CIP 108061 / JCM 11494 / NBRC 100937 / ID131577) TaxID=469383 RepID=D3F685_CONWI|nr:aminoglycoside phosphotransferase family protein [Conexibacter woesei]ADB48758.1 aminoglycoside phosphotransferase [Conexibacter woesei DSM 14684]